MNRTAADRVLNAGISIALDHLVKRGEFYPFAVALARDEQIQVVQAQEDGQRPQSGAFIDALREVLLNGVAAGSYSVVAVVADFALAEATGAGERDAVRIAIESEEDDPVTCYLPYTVVTPGGTRDVRPGELFARRGERTIFGPFSTS